MILRMKSQTTFALALLVALVGLPALAVADPWAVTLTGTYGNDGWNYGGVYTSPYVLSATNGHTNLTGIAFACDDFATNINFNYSWSANLLTLADVTDGDNHPQKFPDSSGTPVRGPVTVTLPDGTQHSYTAYQAYEAAGFLAQDILNSALQPDHLNEALANEDSYAIWQIFDSTAYRGYNGQLGDSYASAVQARMEWAFGQVASGARLSQTLDIFTPCGYNPGGCSNPPGSAASQEFLGFGLSADIVAPEGSTDAFLLFDFLVALGAFFLLRKRFARRLIAKP